MESTVYVLRGAVVGSLGRIMTIGDLCFVLNFFVFDDSLLEEPQLPVSPSAVGLGPASVGHLVPAVSALCFTGGYSDYIQYKDYIIS